MVCGLSKNDYAPFELFFLNVNAGSSYIRILLHLPHNQNRVRMHHQLYFTSSLHCTTAFYCVHNSPIRETFLPTVKPTQRNVYWSVVRFVSSRSHVSNYNELGEVDNKVRQDRVGAPSLFFQVSSQLKISSAFFRHLPIVAMNMAETFRD